MKIGIFVTAAFCKKEYLNAISGHVQIPLMAARILSEAGYDITLITTKPEGAEFLPEVAPRNISVRLVEHASGSWPDCRTHSAKAVKQIVQLSRLLRGRTFDVIHFFGSTKTGLLLCAIKRLGCKSLAVFTPFKRLGVNSTGVRGRLLRAMFVSVNKIIATTDYVADEWLSVCNSDRVLTLYPGITKVIPEFTDETRQDSVLFWRNAGFSNGADLAIKSFKQLAPAFPDVRFVFAVRPHDHYERELLELKKHIPNIEVYTYPYDPGVSIETLLQKSLFVVQPFRSLSLNPQMSILESLYAGVPVVTTKIESNEELVQDRHTGLLVPSDNEDVLTRTIASLLNDRQLLTTLRRKASVETRTQWNWELFGRGLLKLYQSLD